MPANLAQVEDARSRTCVQSLARLAEFQTLLEPYVQKADRLNALGRAVSLENRGIVEPFDTTDTLEVEVARWFAADSALAVRYLTQPDSAISEERSGARNAILEKLRGSIDEISAEVQGKAEEGASFENAAQPCFGAVLVRSAVLEECATTDSPVCEAARAEDPQGPLRFVDNPEDLWDMEQYGPWSPPAPLQRGPEGAIGGARTGARARRGNVVFSVNLAPLLRSRSELEDEEIRDFQANLDSLGITFDHPLVAMAPAIELQANLPPPLGGEDLYLLHFGDLSGDDVIWSFEAGSGPLVQAVFLATAQALQRLQLGEVVSLTAVRTSQEEGGQAEAVFSVSLLQVGQASNVGTLLEYMATGDLARDLLALLPPGSEE